MVDLAEGSFAHAQVNLEKFNAFVADSLKIVGDLTIPFKLIQDDFYKSEQIIFNLSRPGGYKDLSAKYKPFKQKKFGNIYPILFATGRLAASLLSPSGGEAISEIKPTSLRIGTRVPYGIYHQSDKPRTKIPLRKFIFIDGQGVGFPGSSIFQGRSERWKNIIGTHILEHLKLRSKG